MKTPWINYKEMKEISSRQKVFINYSCQIKPTKKKDHASLLNSPNSDLDNLLDIEKEDDANHQEEQVLVAQVDSGELPIPSEMNVEDQMNNLLKTEEADGINPVEKQDFTTHLDIDRELHIPSKTNIVDEMNDLLETEEVAETNPVEERDLVAHLDSNRELLIPSEMNVEDEMKNLLETEETNETNPVEEQQLVARLDSNRELLIPSEMNVEDEMNDLLETEKTDETNPVEEQQLVAQLDSNRELLIPSEMNVEDEMKNLLETEETNETNPVEEQQLVAQLDSDCEPIPSETNVKDQLNNLLETEVEDGTNPVEKQDFTDRELPDTSKTNIEDEMNNVLETEKVNGADSEEEQDIGADQDSNREFWSSSESDVKAEMMHPEEPEKKNLAGHNSPYSGSVQGKVCSITGKIPISTHVEIDNFLHAPICGEIVKNTFDFLDLDNHLTPQFETKLFNTTTDYPEQPDCRLVHSKINEIIFLMKTDTNEKNNQKSKPSKSVVVPLHNTQSIKKGETNNHSYTSDDFMHIRVPVVVGEYKIELCLEEYIKFEKGIVGVKDISNEVVLTNCRFVPNQFSQSLGNGTCAALKGNFFIEGFIKQHIEYTEFHKMNAVPEQNESFIHSNQLCQNIVLELIIHILQVQKIRVSYDSQGF